MSSLFIPATRYCSAPLLFQCKKQLTLSPRFVMAMGTSPQLITGLSTILGFVDLTPSLALCRFSIGQQLKAWSGRARLFRLPILQGLTSVCSVSNTGGLDRYPVHSRQKVIVSASRDSVTPSSADGQQKGNALGVREIIQKLLQNIAKALGVVVLTAVLALVGAPSFLSWPSGRKAMISLANKNIPGTVSVNSVSLGWNKPVLVEGVYLQDKEGDIVLSIPKLETKARLFSLILGRSGFGDCTITSPTMDLHHHPANNLPRLALAITSSEKLLANKSSAIKKTKKLPEPPADVTVSAEVKAAKGNLVITGGKLTLPQDVVAVIGNKIFVNVSFGQLATKESDDLKIAAEERSDGLPVVASLWSECAHTEAVGFMMLRERKIKLIRPFKAEADLTPAIAKLYLSRISPLLGEIIGPAVKDDDMPDVTVYMSPRFLELPADQYKIRVEPMKVTLARGQLVDGVLSLLSKQELAKGSKDLTMQTSAIEADVKATGDVVCSRFDVLIADKVHVATWGVLDWLKETMEMTVAIPGATFRDVLGLSKTPSDYYLEVPIRGTFEKPKVDWKSAAIGVTQLTVWQKSGQFIQGIMKIFEDTSVRAPDPIGTMPWDSGK